MKIYMFIQYPGGLRLEVPGLSKEEAQTGHKFVGEGDFQIEFDTIWGSQKVDEGEHIALDKGYKIRINGVELPRPKTRTLLVDGKEVIKCGRVISWQLQKVGLDLGQVRV